MTQIKAFDQTNLKEIRVSIEAALNRVRNEYGIELKVGNISYNGGEFTAKLEGRSNDKAIVQSSIKGKFAKYGLPSTLLGKVFKYNGKDYEITGVDTRKRRSPILLKEVKTGKSVSCSADLIRIHAM